MAIFRIRRVSDDTTPANAAAIRQMQKILQTQFPGVSEEDFSTLPTKLRDPFKQRLRPLLFVAEDGLERVRGFALLFHAPDLAFCYLDFIATVPGKVGGGIGGALYERVREEAFALDAVGLFFECLPDDPALSRNPEIRNQNASRLRFYERYGARPIANTAYETPLEEGGDNPPYLVFDGLGRPGLPGRDQVGAIVRAILERKYGAVCPPEYVKIVVESFRDSPIVLRAPRYVKTEPAAEVKPQHAVTAGIPLVVNDKHEIHHVRERGYVEAPIRIEVILRELRQAALFEPVEPRHFPDTHIRAVHDGRYVDYLRRACEKVEASKSIYPYVFPIRNQARPPKELPLRAGYFCIDTFTPLNANAYLAARRGVDCVLTAAERVLEGHPFAYALVRPPGHHAERRSFGGFCYFNNAGIAAQYLSRYGRVAILDIDYHHGNGMQDIFYHRRDVLTVSIHGHPSFAYPYFSGFAKEQGAGPGSGYNSNFPLPETITPAMYLATLEKALQRVARFNPDFFVLSLGFDTAAGDPTGSWTNRNGDFYQIGKTLGRVGYPTLIVQEGGYRTRTLGANARRFFEGLVAGANEEVKREPAARRARKNLPDTGMVSWRDEVRESDLEDIRSLVASTGAFTPDEVGIAVELVRERLKGGVDSGYHFLLAERGHRVVGYTCYGPIPGTENRFDLYWIVVHPDFQGFGLGAALLAQTETAVAKEGCNRVYVETSTTPSYEAARSFYRRMGFKTAAELKDYYRDGDGKLILVKTLDGDGRSE